MLRKTLLQSRAFFKEGFLPVDVDKALTLSLEALKELVAMDLSLREFSSLQTAAIENLAQTRQQARSIGLPAVGNVDGYSKTFAQKAHHFGKALLSIARLFYPAANNWDKLLEIVESKYGKEDIFSKLIAEIKPTLLTVLNLRDSLEHHNEGVTIRDFAMEQDGTIAPPAIELNFRKSKLPRVSVSSLMDEMTKALLVYFEMIIVNLCSKSVLPVSGLQVYVGELPKDFQQAQHIRFGYFVQTPDGRMLPFG
jgi:hypothetical protein